MTYPLVRYQIGHKNLASPYTAVIAVTRPIQRKSDDFLIPAVLGQAGRDVSMVMLNRDQWNVFFFFGPLGGKVIRMQVVSDGNGFDF